MKTTFWAGIILLATLMAAPAQTNDLTALLQQGLLEEQANQNLDAAIMDYQALATKFDLDRKLAATAVFRIGECYRMQGRTNAAAAQYERVLRDFSDQKVLVTLSQENLKGMGVILGQRMEGVLSRGPQDLSAGAMSTETASLAAQIQVIESLRSNPAEQAAEAQAIFPDDTLKNMLLNLPKLQEQVTNLTANPDLNFQEFFKKFGMVRVAVYTADSNGNGGFDEYLARPTNLLARAQTEVQRQLAAMQERVHFILEIQRAHLKVLQATAGAATEMAGNSNPSPSVSDEDREIQRIQDMAQNSPDLMNTRPASGMLPLVQAAYNGWLKVAGYLLDHGADVNADQGAALISATASGNRTMVQFLLAHGAEVNAKDGGGKTPLQIAVKMNYLAVVEVLIRSKADVNASDSDGVTPLLMAADNGQVKLMQMLLAAGANPKQAEGDGKTPLYCAAKDGFTDVVKTLLAAGADPNAADQLGGTPLYAAILGNSPETVKLLLAAKADPDGGPMNAPLYAAIHKHDLISAEALLAAGADPHRAGLINWDVEMANAIGWWNHRGDVTPLWMAIDLKQLPMVQLLLKYKADPDDTLTDGQSLLFKALKQPDILAAMLDAGAKVDAVSAGEEELTPLGMAVENNLVPAVDILLKHGADPNVRNRNGVTPLHAAEYGMAGEKVFELLFAHGANPNVRTGNGRTPLDELKNRVAKETDPEVQARAVVLADLLRRHGALDRLPDWDRITVGRPAANIFGPVFYQGKNSWNHFTLLETILNAYISAPGFPMSGGYGSPRFAYLGEQLPFPDLAHITIVRPNRDLTNETRTVVNLLNATNGIDFSRDVPLEFGDVVEIPERDHALNEQSSGLTQAQHDGIAGHFGGKVQLVVKGQSTELQIYPQPEWSYLKRVLAGSEAQKVLLASSDLSQVKVTRQDPQTGKKLEWTLDCTVPADSGTTYYPPNHLRPRAAIPTMPNSGNFPPGMSPGNGPSFNEFMQSLSRNDNGNNESSSSDLWLRDGDVIEMPEK